jgi:hypothetical protein
MIMALSSCLFIALDRKRQEKASHKATGTSRKRRCGKAIPRSSHADIVRRPSNEEYASGAGPAYAANRKASQPTNADGRQDGDAG